MTNWQTKRLEDLTIKKGLVRGPFGGALKKEKFKSSGYKVYEQRNAIYQTTELGEYYIDDDKYEQLKRFSVNEGDFIVSCSGTIGRIFRIPEGAPEGVINQALLKITIDDDVVLPEYFHQYFNWDRFQSDVIDNTQGGAMQNLVGMDIFRSTKMLIPEKPEQERIVSVLEVWDEYVEKLEQKIALKEHLKIALMQQLFLCKRRLQDFSDPWREVRLEEVATVERGRPLSSRDLISGEYPVIAGGKTSPYRHADYTHEDVITVSASGANAGYAAYQARKVWASDCSVVFGRTSEYLTLYIYYWLHFMQDRIYMLQTGGAQPHVQPPDLRRFKISIPSREEQLELISIFGSVDLEINILEKLKREITQQKKYLLKNLITGAIRTPENLTPKGPN